MTCRRCLCQTAAIQLNLRLAVSAESFFGPNLVNDLSSELGFALYRSRQAAHTLAYVCCAVLLRIPPSRIRIVQVRAGSVDATVSTSSSLYIAVIARR